MSQETKPAKASGKNAALPLLPRRVVAPLLVLGLRSFDRLVEEGVLTAARAGKGGRPSLFDVGVVVPAYIAHERQRTAVRGTGATDRDRRDRSQAELNELKLARERRALLPREQVVREGQAFIVATVAKLRSLPARLLRAGVIAPAAEPVVVELLREAQEEMARWSTHLDLVAALEEAPAS